MAVRFETPPPPGVVLQEELESVQKRAARFVTGNYNYETWSMAGILGQLKWEFLRQGGKIIDLYCYIKILKVKPVYQQMTLSPKLGVVEISTLWHFRLPLLIQMFIKVSSSPRLSGIGMPSPIFWSRLLKMQMIVLLSSLLWWELGTNSLITGPGEWLSFRRFTSKLSWSRSWCALEVWYQIVWPIRESQKCHMIITCWCDLITKFAITF